MSHVPVAVPVIRARTAWQRLRGLLGRWRLAPGQGLLLEPCRAVHTLGMRRPIDVVFLSADGTVLDVRRGLGAGRIAVCRRAAMALEFAVGDTWRLGLSRGCRVVPVDARGVR